MIVNEIIARVRHIRCGEGTGTAFFTEVDGRQYLITAKHGVATLSGRSSIEMHFNEKWETLPVEVVGHSTTNDVSVLAPLQSIGPIPGKVMLSAGGVVYGQEAYFLGFPHGLYGNVGTLIGGFPLPYVKRCLVSNFSNGRNSDWYLDGLNNVGFSGGPVVFRNQKSKRWQIGASIAGWLPVEEEILKQGRDTGLRYEANTGIIVAAPIACAMDLIAANPIGRRIAS